MSNRDALRVQELQTFVTATQQKSASDNQQRLDYADQVRKANDEIHKVQGPGGP